MQGIRQRYNPVSDTWIFESPIRLDPAAMKFAIENARKIQSDRLLSKKPGAMKDAIRASVAALNAGRVVQALLGEVKDYPIFKATTRERPERTFFIPREA